MYVRRDLSALQGKRILSGVWMETWTYEQVHEVYGEDWSDRDAESWLILLDGRLYRITEDVDDGYRSHCREIREVNNIMPVNWWQTSETVYCHYVTKWPGSFACIEQNYKIGEWWLDDWELPKEFESRDMYYDRVESCELLVLVSKATNLPVCIFGTDNTEDYYPTFVAKFYPQHMGINGDLIDITGRNQS